jgi:2-polyprenyl-3-methyl-5-hydroxy-6-metoxy-1,4-benzoquinol methylase
MSKCAGVSCINDESLDYIVVVISTRSSPMKDSRSHEDSFVTRVIRAYSGSLDSSLYAAELWPKTVREARRVLRLLDAAPPGSMLDLACGTGAVTTALALEGFALTGLDCNPEALEIARRMSADKGADVVWRCQDMRTLDHRAHFDAVLLRDVVFGLFEEENEDLNLLARIAAALKHGGRSLFEVYNREFALEHGVERRFFYDARANRFVDCSDRNPNGLSLRLYSRDEWESLLASAGLELLKTDGWSWPNDPPPPPWRADYLVAGKAGGRTTL